MSDGPTLERDGDALIWVWAEKGIAIGFDQIRESSDGVYAEITIEGLASAEGTVRRGHFHWAKINLASTRSRADLARTLNAKNDRINWVELLDIACLKTVETWRQGEPVVNLTSLEPQEDEHYLVTKLLPSGESTVIFADGGSGKSIFALAVGMIVRTGGELPNGLQARKACNVLYLDWETNAREQATRMRQLARGFGLADLPTILYRPMYRALADDIDRIRQEVSRHAVGLVIVDSIAPACGGEPESAEVMLRTFNAMRSLSSVTRLVISHVSRQGAEQKNGSARPFGSVFTWNLARSVWELRRGGDGVGHAITIGLYHRKTNHGRLLQPLSFRIVFDDERAIRFEPADVTDDPELAAHTSLSYRVRRVLSRGALTTEQIAEALDVSKDTVRSTLSRMPDVQRLSVGGGRGNMTTWGLIAKDFDNEPRF